MECDVVYSVVAWGMRRERYILLYEYKCILYS